MITTTEGLAARDKALYGLAVCVTFEDGESPQSDFYEIKDRVLDWHRSRGSQCGGLKIEYHIPRAQWQAVEDFWAPRVASDHLMRDVFSRIAEVEITLLTPTGNEIKSIAFEPSIS
jgi:hypothetical protein